MKLINEVRMFYFILAFGVSLSRVFSKSPELYVGSKCHNSDESGICTLITKCPAALDAVKEQGSHDFRRCGFERFTEIVCCPNPDLRSTKPTTKKPDKDDDDNKKTETRGTDVARKGKEACDKYSRELPIILTYHIVGGENAELKEFPHMAALGFYNEADLEYRFDCGGTLISDNYIVTAAHCIVNVQQNKLKIARLGVINVPISVDRPDPKIDYNVVNVTVHRDYNWKEKFNDIALVKLEKKVTFSDEVRPACLYSRNDDPEKLIVTGWGAVNLGGERSTILQKATLSPVSLSECNSTYLSRTNRYLTKNQMCAADSRSDACQGDSGGPLQTQSNSSILTIVGITSYGIGCGSRYPGIYTRVSSYLEWIEGIVWS